MVDKPRKKIDLKQKMLAKLEALKLEEEHEAVWNSFCENCRDRLDGLEVWINLTSRDHDDDDPIKTYYCGKCVKIDSSRRRRRRSRGRP